MLSYRVWLFFDGFETTRDGCTAVKINEMPSLQSVFETVAVQWAGVGSTSIIMPACLVILWTLIKRRRRNVSRCPATVNSPIGFQNELHVGALSLGPNESDKLRNQKHGSNKKMPRFH